MLAIMGGSGLNNLPELKIQEERLVATPYGDCSAAMTLGHLNEVPIVFMPRHGKGHKLAPHQINYRANIWALKELGVSQILAINAVGGISEAMAPGVLVVPNQLIDYSWGREQSYNFVLDGYVNHIDFTHPYSPVLAQQLVACLTQQGLGFQTAATYACTQGPRLETAAEIRRLQRDGCDIVGMTAMPEAALARELGMDYAALCLVVNWAAGLTDEELSLAEMLAVLEAGMGDIKKILCAFAKTTFVHK